MILLVAETRHNQAVMQQYRHVLASTFPLGTAQILSSLRKGRMPEHHGIVVL